MQIERPIESEELFSKKKINYIMMEAENIEETKLMTEFIFSELCFTYKRSGIKFESNISEINENTILQEKLKNVYTYDDFEFEMYSTHGLIKNPYTKNFTVVISDTPYFCNI